MGRLQMWEMCTVVPHVMVAANGYVEAIGWGRGNTISACVREGDDRSVKQSDSICLLLQDV